MELLHRKKVSGFDEELQQSLARYFVLRANFKLYIVSKNYKINKQPWFHMITKHCSASVKAQSRALELESKHTGLECLVFDFN